VLVHREQVERSHETIVRFVIAGARLVEHPGELHVDLTPSDREQGRAHQGRIGGEHRFEPAHLRPELAHLALHHESPAAPQQ
jgi:hypothetical protein